MIDILVLTREEAETRVECFKRENQAGYDALRNSLSGSVSELLRTQRYTFVAELSAYVADDVPGKFYFESMAFPFTGWADSYDDIPSLVQGVKDAIRHQTPKNIEALFYTVPTHAAENQCLEPADARESEAFQQYVDSLLPELDSCGVSREEFDQFMNEYQRLSNAVTRGLTEEERKEFIRLYG